MRRLTHVWMCGAGVIYLWLWAGLAVGQGVVNPSGGAGSGDLTQAAADLRYALISVTGDLKKAVADVTYAPISVTGDLKKAVADLTYAPISVTGDLKKAVADVTYAPISVTGATSSALSPFSAGFTIDGGGGQIATGLCGFVVIPYAATITNVAIVSTGASSVVIDVRKCAYAVFDGGVTRPTTTDTIFGTDVVGTSLAAKTNLVAAATWTTNVSAMDVLGLYVTAATNAYKSMVVLGGTK